MMIIYKDDALLRAEHLISLYSKCSLGVRRPLERPKMINGMIENSNLIVTAWDNQKLVGISRCLTDFNYVTYLADLAVDEDYQRKGIGKQLIRETQMRVKDSCRIILLAAPEANDYYFALGFEHNPRGWMLSVQL
ncbi:GNAT family N-acetyltransferase [Budvicia aquatica]|uniref:GNAT family N-acetyltransferase n=1 Tax=Budvicia aquatica TaxID=82979 RepID=UPI0020868BF4|nr:GNAT family N-acetyltransferase [Budvicia aquatica]GKX52984.1 N-acetyltransferase [Budvicia aquatica]